MNDFGSHWSDVQFAHLYDRGGCYEMGGEAEEVYKCPVCGEYVEGCEIEECPIIITGYEEQQLINQ